MKLTVILLFCALYNCTFGQIKNAPPALENVSKTDIKLIEPLEPGMKIVFTQECNPNLPDTVSDGIVQFEGLHVVNDKVVASIEFKDTVIQRMIFEFKTDDADALKYFNVPIDDFTELSRNNYYRSYLVGKCEYVCFINRRKVTLIKTLIKAGDF